MDRKPVGERINPLPLLRPNPNNINAYEANCYVPPINGQCAWCRRDQCICKDSFTKRGAE